MLDEAVPVTLPVKVRSNPSSNRSSLAPSAATSRPSTVPETTIFPAKVAPVLVRLSGTTDPASSKYMFLFSTRFLIAKLPPSEACDAP